MKIEWNSVTWYSKLLAVVVFVVALFVAFCLGIQYEQMRVAREKMVLSELSAEEKNQQSSEETKPTPLTVSTDGPEETTPDQVRLGDIKRLQVALELYFSDNNKYPVVPSEITIGDSSNTCLSSNGFGVKCGDIIYWSPLPTNPTPGGADYKYKSANGKTYNLSFSLDTAVDPISEGPHVAVPEGVN